MTRDPNTYAGGMIRLDDLTDSNSDATAALRAAFVAQLKPSGDATGAADTAAIQAALAAMPTRTVYAIPATSSGASATYPVGTIRLGPGDWHIGGAADIGNIGPFVNLIGAGRNTTRVFYHGAGDAIRMFNGVFPTDDNFDTIAAWHGIINGFDLDGTYAQPGANGLHYGDTEGGTLGPDLMIRNFVGGQLTAPTGLTLGTAGTGGSLSATKYYWKVTAVGPGGESWGSNEVNATVTAGATQPLTWSPVTGATGYRIYRYTSTGLEKYIATVSGGSTTSYTDTGTTGSNRVIPQANITGSTGLRLDNAVSWTENLWARVSVINCDNAVIIETTTGDGSFEYNEFDFKVYCFAGQNGVVVRDGAFLNNGSLRVRANMGQSSTAMTSAVLTVTGTSSTGAWSYITNQRLDVQAESNNVGQGTSQGPMTIRIGRATTGNNVIQHCIGVIRFNLPGLWTPSNWSRSSTNSNAFTFAGIISGDANLHTATDTAGFQVAGSISPSETAGFYNGANLTFQNQIGDILSGTLTQNSTIAFQNTHAGPQCKTVILKQNATGGFTVTWPKTGTPTTASPTILWAGGTAPTMTAAANATDIYELVTADGATWYGRVVAQNVS